MPNQRYLIPTTRMETFSDGVFAIVITLLAFQFKVPDFKHGADIQENFRQLMNVTPNFISFLFSFLFVAVFWANHHQLFHSIKDANRKLIWLNIHLLFWIIMIPFPTAMVGDHPTVPLSAISLAFVLLMVFVSSYIVRLYSYHYAYESNEKISARIIKGGLTKNVIAVLLNLASIAVAFYSVTISYIIFVVMLIIFSIPHQSEKKDQLIIKK